MATNNNKRIQSTINAANNNDSVLKNYEKKPPFDGDEAWEAENTPTSVTDRASGKSYEVYKNKLGEVTTVGRTGAADSNTRAAGQKFYYQGDDAKRIASDLAKNQDEADMAEFKKDMLEANPKANFKKDEFMNKARVDHVKNSPALHKANKTSKLK
tara:strand:- start:464 stop:931 length:468 start_codon:yes stop_codon:yes gene_type:complete